MAKTRSPRRASRSSRRYWVVLALIVLAALGWARYGEEASIYARTGAAYGARVGCSCRFIAQRPLDQCEDDLIEGMALISLGDDEATRSVTARFPLLASETATYRDGYGCVLESWRD